MELNDTEYLQLLNDTLDKNNGYLSMFDKYQYNIDRMYHIYLHFEYLIEPTHEMIENQRKDVEELLESHNIKQKYLIIFLWKKSVLFIDKTQLIEHYLKFLWFSDIELFESLLNGYLVEYQSKKEKTHNPLEEQFIIRGSPEEQEWNERVLNSRGSRSEQSEVFQSIHNSINKISRNNALEVVKSRYSSSYLESHYPQLYKKLYPKK